MLLAKTAIFRLGDFRSDHPLEFSTDLIFRFPIQKRITLVKYSVSSVFIFCLVCIVGIQAQLMADDFRSLFNGRDLTGWDGNPELWTVEEGWITGKTTDPAQLTYNQFLICREGSLKDFELHAKIKVTVNNTGIQYRSKESSGRGIQG